MRRANMITLAAFLLQATITGGNFVAVRFSNLELAPIWGAALRFAPGALFLAAIALLWGRSRPNKTSLQAGLVYGVLQIAAYFALAYWALLEVPAGVGAIITSTVPVITLVLAWIHGLEKLRWTSVTASIIALAGIGVVYVGQVSLGVPVLSLLAMVGAAICASEATVLLKYFEGRDPIWTAAIGSGVGAVLLFFLSRLVNEPINLPSSAPVWTALAYLVFIGSLVFVLYVFVVSRWKASMASYVFVVIPFVTVILGAIVASEPIRLQMVVGGALVAAGVWFGLSQRQVDEESEQAG